MLMGWRTDEAIHWPISGRMIFIVRYPVSLSIWKADCGKNYTGCTMEEQLKIIKAPSGRERLKWLGPAFIWMLSAAGSGELLFTPRIASQYGYSLVWALILAVAMKWFINREIGRYTVCTGATFFRGLTTISGSSRYLLWLIVVPQLVVAVATIAGLGGAAATALITLLDLPLTFFVVLIILVAAVVISLGQYYLIEKVTIIFAIVISLAIVAAALSTDPDSEALARGFVPQVPREARWDELLSWLGFMLAGAAGLMWFSYWVAARGYGAAQHRRPDPVDLKHLDKHAEGELRGWIKHMTIVNTLAVIGALVIAMAFLILGTELLKPEKLIPEENKVAEALGRLLGDVWGPAGFWFMVLAVFLTFFSTLLADQDGFGRMFSDATQILTGKEMDNRKLWKWIVPIVLGLMPIGTYVLVGEPVRLLKVAGVIEACHIPIVTALILYLNKMKLPEGLRPSVFSFAATCLAGVTFLLFGVIYCLQIVGVIR
jgi:Mn2+/Fe2+ NRAMP family transporter